LIITDFTKASEPQRSVRERGFDCVRAEPASEASGDIFPPLERGAGGSGTINNKINSLEHLHEEFKEVWSLEKRGKR